jgi:putative addiction module component (TIGR02574 family)
MVEALWNSLAADPAHVPIPDWHREILAERMAEDDAVDTAGKSWDEVRQRIERR